MGLLRLELFKGSRYSTYVLKTQNDINKISRKQLRASISLSSLAVACSPEGGVKTPAVKPYIHHV